MLRIRIAFKPAIRNIAILVGLMHAQQAFSQSGTPALAGEYFLEGRMEVASVLWLKADSTFQFFFSYGAMDRSGQGRWSYTDGHVALRSQPRPPKDFALTSKMSRSHAGTRFRVTDQNPMLLSYVLVKAHTPNGVVEGRTDQKGYFVVASKQVNKVELLFELCPERYSSYDLGRENDYEFRFEPWISEIFFESFKLRHESNILTGPHPLLEGDNFRFVKGTL